MSEDPAAPVQTVTQNVLRKQQDNRLLKQQILNRREKAQKLRKTKQDRSLTNPELFVKQYRQKQASYTHLKRQAGRAPPPFPVNKVVFAARIRSMRKLPPEALKVLKLLRLTQLHTGCFLKLTPAIQGYLRQVEPFVAYGYLTRRTISDLVFKRGHLKVEGHTVPLTDNEKVEQALGEHGVLCIEDLVHEIATCGGSFQMVSGLLAPFRLNPPSGGFKGKARQFRHGGDWGNREEHMDVLVKQML